MIRWCRWRQVLLPPGPHATWSCTEEASSGRGLIVACPWLSSKQQCTWGERSPWALRSLWCLRACMAWHGGGVAGVALARGGCIALAASGVVHSVCLTTITHSSM